MILLIDNFDSFTYNLAQYLGELGAEPLVKRNDAVTIDEIREMAPSGILLSPGPKTPADHPAMLAIIREFAGRVPMFGVCLGHQAIAHVYGGSVRRADRLMHGKTSPIVHTGKAIFQGLANPFAATRYHSLVVDRDTLPPDLEITAWTPEGEVMGIQHRRLQLWGVQFHPESILTLEGKALLGNFLSLAG